MSKTQKKEPQEWSEEGYEAFVNSHPDYPESEMIECLNLIMSKENALDIINGVKKIEFRSYTDHYCNRLYDKKTDAYIQLHKNEPEILFWCDSLRPVEMIHFHNYNNTWTLDVECLDNGTISATKEDVDYLHKEFDCNEMDELHEKCMREGGKHFPLFFYFELGNILKRENI